MYPLPPNPDNHPNYKESYGWYKNTNDNVDMASIMHNPWEYPTIVEHSAMLVFQRKAHFVENYDISEHLVSILREFFGNINQLRREGLSKQFINLKKVVEKECLIGLIFWGTDINRIDMLITKYSQLNKDTNETNEIDITVNSICQILIREYIKEQNVDDLCKKTPNFNIYYDVLKKSNGEVIAKIQQMRRQPLSPSGLTHLLQMLPIVENAGGWDDEDVKSKDVVPESYDVVTESEVVYNDTAAFHAAFVEIKRHLGLNKDDKIPRGGLYRQ